VISRAVLIWSTVLLATPAFAQSHAAAGAIEGTVFTASGSVLPGVTVVITNTGTQTERAAVTNEHGLFRALMLPPGIYRVAAQVPGFRRFEQTETILHQGHTVIVNATLTVGEINDAVRVRGDARPPIDAGNIDAARPIRRGEIEALPLPTRNAFNLARLSSAVSGAEDVEFNAPHFSASA
jgi:hypothetical protein